MKARKGGKKEGAHIKRIYEDRKYETEYRNRCLEYKKYLPFFAFSIALLWHCSSLSFNLFLSAPLNTGSKHARRHNTTSSSQKLAHACFVISVLAVLILLL
jgi:hypothetical protein